MKIMGLNILIVSVLVLLSATTACRSGGGRDGLMLNVYFALRNYANDHNGWFPQDEKGSYIALQKLYPIYCPSGKELAGLSGNIDSVIECLKKGEPLTDKITSWNYVQGFRDNDDPNVVIIWEVRGGIFPSGKNDPSGGHAVLLLDGETKQISDASWTNFLKQQEQLRKVNLDKRNTQGKNASELGSF